MVMTKTRLKTLSTACTDAVTCDKTRKEKRLYLLRKHRRAARTLFRWLYLAHFCSFFRRFFAVFSVLTPEIQKVAPEDRGPVA